MGNMIVTFAAKLFNLLQKMTGKEKVCPQKWEDLGAKDKAALVTACVSFGLGFLLLFIGLFLDPAGEIDGSVITAFGTALLYAAGIFGVAMYFKTSNNEMMNSIIRKIDEVVEERIANNCGTKDGDDTNNTERRRV